MPTPKTPSEQIIDEVTSWPGIEAGPGSRQEFAFRVGRREIGHLHGDHAAHFGFPKDVWGELRRQGRIAPHPVFPGREGPAARRIADERDVRDVIALLRLNYERAVARRGLASPVPGLYATSPEPLPFAPGTEIRAFLLRREQGNVLLYSTSRLGEDAAALERLGGVSRQYLNHRHEAMFASPGTAAPLFVHEAERAAVQGTLGIRATFTRRHLLDDDLEVIPTPGHTPGATAFLWDTGEHRVLFTGDTIFLREGGVWAGAVLASSDRRAYVESLELLRDLEFEVLVPWGAPEGEPFHALTDAADARRRIDALLVRVLRGEAG